MNHNMYKIGFVAFALVFLAARADALPTVGKTVKKNVMKTAAGCSPATAVIDLDINNIRARLMTGGDMWWDQGTTNAAYEAPKGSRKNSLYAGSCWVGGFQNGSLKVAAQTYRQDGNDYWPGPLNTNKGTYEIDAATCNEWDRFWKLDRTVVNEFKLLSDYEAAMENDRYRTIFEWPARGNGAASVDNTNGKFNGNKKKAKGVTGKFLAMDDRDYAPFVDLDGNGIYNPELGEYPNMEDPGRGDQMVWWVFNDRGNSKLQTQSESIGLEIQTSAFAFSTKDFLNDATFYDYKVINRAGLTLDSAFMSTWTDADLGYAQDDFIGCDTLRGLGILYNAKPVDGNGEPTSYGANPPMVGVDFFIGPQLHYIDSVTGRDTTRKLKMTAFTYFNNRNAGFAAEILDPETAVQFYNYMTGSRKFGKRFTYDPNNTPCTGLSGNDPVSYVFAGEINSGWSECICSNTPGDRRFIHSAGPFQLRPGDINDIIIGAVWVANAGGCPTGSFAKIKVADDLTQELFDNNFRTIEGPEAPRVTYREMDRKVLFYLQNDPVSTNFQEKYGYETDSVKYRVVSRKAYNIGKDSIYRFEGYRVFQLKNALITPAQIFDENGALDETVAREVFQTDIQNGVSKIIGWSKDTKLDGCDNCWVPVVKVDGKDSGLRHSFQIANDAFATGDDQRLVNYKTYYFLAIAYAHNNFADFNQFKTDSTQDRPYLESAHGPNGKALSEMIIAAMPNPSNGNMGTVFNSDYGDGVIIKQLEGKGNGGLDLQLSAVSEEEALLESNGYESAQPVYEAGRGPISVKVIDPLKVPASDWKLYIVKDATKSGDIAYADAERGIIPENAKWALVKDGDMSKVIYSERNLDAINEQIIEEYGLSIALKQTERPGTEQTETSRNGLISSYVTYNDATKPWLAGVNDGEQESPTNWIRSGGFDQPQEPLINCNYADNKVDTLQFYESLLSGSIATIGTWAPYDLAVAEDMSICGFGVSKSATTVSVGTVLNKMQSVDIVFTPDQSKWSRCVVLELTDDDKNIDGGPLSEGNARKFALRKHASWNLEVDGSGNPVYATDANDYGFSYFPGYAINQETGERLNIFFGESSFLKGQNGSDMIWNPTSLMFDNVGNPIFGGRHYIYVHKTKYDGCDSIRKFFDNSSVLVLNNKVFQPIMWVGLPLASQNVPLLSLKDGLIPTETRVSFRVTRPYAYRLPAGVSADNTFEVPGYPKYQFNTGELAPYQLADPKNPYSADRKKLLDGMQVVPNPYYAYNGYEKNRLDTRVRIINLPPKATIHIYSLDGSLIKMLTKDDNLPYIDWDIRNAKGLPIASGMYLVHIKADGIGEKVVKWFGAMRPVDATSF